MSIAQVLAILWGRKWTAALVLAAAIVAALATLAVLPRRYDATALVFINLGETDPVTNAQLISGSMSRSYINTQIETIKSKGVSLKVVENLRLADDPKRQASFQSSTSGKGNIKDWIATDLVGGLRVERVGGGDIVSITYRASTPEDAAKIANAFVSAYIDKDIELRVMPARDLVRWSEERLAVLQRNLTDAQRRRSELRQAAASIEGADSKSTASEDATGLSRELSNARVEIIQTKIALDQARAGQAPVTESQELAQLRRQIADLELTISREAPRLGPEHNRIQTLQQNRAGLQAQIITLLKKGNDDLIASLEQKLRSAERRVEELNSALDSHDGRGLGAASPELLSLDREIEALKNQVDALLQRRERLRLGGAVDQGAASQLSAAAEPSEASFPKIRIVLGLAVGLGLAFGLALAFLREMFDRRVRSVADVTSYADVPLLAVVPKAKIRQGSQGAAHLSSRAVLQLQRPQV